MADMTEEETDRIEELRQRVEELQAEIQLTLADYKDGLCPLEDVEEVTAKLADATNDFRCELLPVM